MSTHDCTCKCVGKGHQLGCCCLEAKFAEMSKPKRTTAEAERERAQARIQEVVQDEVVRA